LVTAPGYGLVDANLQLTDIGNTRLTVTLSVNNLTDSVYLRIPELVGASPGLVVFSIGAPRMAGVRMRYDFGS
jgi:iron complex outermembrane receptor protein